MHLFITHVALFIKKTFLIFFLPKDVLKKALIIILYEGVFGDTWGSWLLITSAGPCSPQTCSNLICSPEHQQFGSV